MINIRVCTARLLKDRFQIEEKTTEILFNEGILQAHVCRNVLIRNEFNEKVQVSGKQELKYNIADRFCVSEATVEKIIAKRS